MRNAHGRSGALFRRTSESGPVSPRKIRVFFRKFSPGIFFLTRGTKCLGSAQNPNEMSRLERTSFFSRENPGESFSPFAPRNRTFFAWPPENPRFFVFFLTRGTFGRSPWTFSAFFLTCGTDWPLFFSFGDDFRLNTGAG